MFKTCVVGISVAASALALAQAPPAPKGPDVRLILLIAVDQFRADYLTRFRDQYTSGFKKLMTEGAYFTNANLDHMPTVTAVGHSTMLSGAYPSSSGIVGNDWFERESGQRVTSVGDTGAKPIGARSGGASPKRLQVSTIGDELKKASKAKKGTPEAPRVIGISFKDRSAILPVGRDADAAYWVDGDKTGAFMTSSYYMSQPPAWLTAFNERQVTQTFAGKTWTSLTAPGETFGVMSGEGAALYSNIYASPYGNDLLLAFAEEVLAQEKLGQRGVTDVFSVSFSSNDQVGHNFGPDSPRVKDISIRTDLVVGKLLDDVDKAIGLNHVLVALTSDHGTAPLPEVRQAAGESGGRLGTDDLKNAVQLALSKRFGEGPWVFSSAGPDLYLNDALAVKNGGDPAQLHRTAAEALKGYAHVAKVYTREDLLRKTSIPKDTESQRVLHGFYPARSADVMVVLEPYWIRQATGTTHGSPWEYDAHIPLILMGPMVKAGEYKDAVILNDLAPTVAAIAGIKLPSAAAGRVLKECLR